MIHKPGDKAAKQAAVDGMPLAVIDSPPGAGKSTLAHEIAALTVLGRGESVLATTLSNPAAEDFAVRAAIRFPDIQVYLFHANSYHLPADFPTLPNLSAVPRMPAGLGPHLCVSNASNLGLKDVPGPYPLLLVDEAYLLRRQLFDPLWHLAHRYFLIGDPGQVDPVTDVDVTPWVNDPQGPHVPLPRAVLAARDDVPVFQLPFTYRLRPDNAALVQQAFYPHMAFQSAGGALTRRFAAVPNSGDPCDPLIDELLDDGSIAMGLLPELVAPEIDPELARWVAQLAARLIQRGAATPQQIGVVATRVAQTSVLQRALMDCLGPVHGRGVRVDTVERWQGLERPVMIVQHPLSGLDNNSDFALKSGRLCVMLSRASVATFVVAREGVMRLASRYEAIAKRPLGGADAEFSGWLAHRLVIDWLRSKGRIKLLL